MDRKRNIEQSMKRLATAVLITFGAFGLHAADQTTTAVPTSTQPQVDSPLVRAAKASQSKATSKKKKIVITNETLAKSGGHITTPTTAPPALPPPPKVDPNAVEMERQKQLAAQRAVADQAKKEAEEKKKRDEVERAAAIEVGDYPEAAVPPPGQPPTMPTQKPPAP